MTHPINHTPSKPLYGVFHYFYQDYFLREIKRIPKKSQGVKLGDQNVITAGKFLITNIRKRLAQFMDSDVGGGGGASPT